MIRSCLLCRLGLGLGFRPLSFYNKGTSQYLFLISMMQFQNWAIISSLLDRPILVTRG